MIFNNKKNILKHTAVDEVYAQIKPSKFFIPSWYKNEKKFESGMSLPKRLPYSQTFKNCTVFSDSLTTGYIIPLSVDISVEQTEGGPVITWNDANVKFLELRDKAANQNLPTPKGHSDNHYVWQTKHLFKIPKGYSALLTHPLNRYDLPFITLSGIIDGEMVVHEGNIPVYFNLDFEGVIEAGTPILQLILFKTENWKNEIDTSIIPEAINNSKRSMNASMGWYKKNIWKKKMYE
jgi:hypothetical protein